MANEGKGVGREHQERGKERQIKGKTKGGKKRQTIQMEKAN